jgi:hypothetical protein
MNRIQLLCAILLVAVAPFAQATPVACGSGTIDFTATSYLSGALTTFNAGQEVVLTAVPGGGIVPLTYSWLIDGPLIKDYEERVGTVSTGALTWSTTAMTAAALATPSLTFYWKPDPTQIHPLTGGAVPRNVSLTVTLSAGGPCTVTQSFSLERSTTDSTKDAESFYTRNHRAATETDPARGGVIDDHVEWHTAFGTHILDFFQWHHEFLIRANLWRAEFGYPQTLTWYPGNALPVGADIDFTPRGGSFVPSAWNIPQNLTFAGTTGGGSTRLQSIASLASLESAIGGWHGGVHCAIGGTMCTFESPRDPIFWRWHGMIDRVYENYCVSKPVACANLTMPLSDAWMAATAADTNGNIPRGGVPWTSPAIWNRRVLATCTPTEALAGTTRTCGSSADHENPHSGVLNYLYATIHNDRASAVEMKYVEVGAYIANASTGLSWPVNFGGDPGGVLPESRQFITVNLLPGQSTDIGPLPWTPPNPVPTDHWCMYARLLSAQEVSMPEGTSLVDNVTNNNSVAWRNMQILTTSTDRASIILRNIERKDARVSVQVRVPPKFFNGGSIQMYVPRSFVSRFATSPGGVEVGSGQPINIDISPRPAMAAIIREPGDQTAKQREDELLKRIDELERQQRLSASSLPPDAVPIRITRPDAVLANVVMKPGEEVPVTLEFTNSDASRDEYLVSVVQLVDGKVVGGNTFIVRTGTHK